MSSDISAISLHQPHASFITCLSKRYETRGRPLPSWAIDKPVALHAAKRAITRDEMAYIRNAVTIACLEGNTEMKLRCRRALEMLSNPLDMHFGAIIAIVTFRASIDAERVRDDPFGHFGPGRYAWPIASVRMIQPIIMPGRQSWFRIRNPELVEQEA